MIEEERRPSIGAGLGHNQPPSPIEFLVAAQREAQTKEKADRLAYIVERANLKQVVDRETAGQAGDIIKVAGEFADPIEKDRIERTRPYREAADAAKAECDRFLEPLHDAVDGLRKRLKAWSDEEDKRIEAQQAEQEAFFAPPAEDPPGQKTKFEHVRKVADRALKAGPPLQPAKKRKIVGDLGARISQVEKKHYRVVDVRAVPDFILNSTTVHEAIVQVVRSLAKHMPAIEGIEITTETDNQVR